MDKPPEIIPPLSARFRSERTLRRFVRTLGDWCAATLDNGEERDGEWVVGDLANRPGDSCWINLSTGLWQDWSSEGRSKGGPWALWAERFGIDPEDKETILAGMEAWLREGKLPDGTGIGCEPEVETRKPRRERKLPWHYRHNAELYARWLGVVKENRICIDLTAQYLAEYRGLSLEVFRWLIEGGYVAWFESEKRRKDGTTWMGWDIAFPVTLRTPEKFLFFGLHLKWLGWERSGWQYWPKGTPAMPLIIGSPVEEAERIILGESTWDVIAAIDLYRLWESPKKWAAIATRGAKNLLYAGDAFRAIHKEARVKILWQNDPSGRAFIARLPKKLCARAGHIRPPETVKDLNDWLRAEGRERVLEKLRNVRSNE